MRRNLSATRAANPQRDIMGEVAQLTRTLFDDLYSCKASRNGRREWRHSPHWDGGLYKGKRRANIWEKIAAFMRDHRLQVVPYVHHAIWGHDLWELPLPNRLLCRPMLADYRRHEAQISTRIEMLRIGINSDLQNASNDVYETGLCYAEMGQPRSCDMQWTSLLAQIRNPVLRFSIASQNCRVREMSNSQEDAEMCYAIDPEVYDRVCHKWLPPGFAAKSRQRYLLDVFPPENTPGT